MTDEKPLDFAAIRSRLAAIDPAHVPTFEMAVADLWSAIDGFRSEYPTTADDMATDLDVILMAFVGSAVAE